MKNDIILFLVMLVIGCIGFNIVSERFASDAVAVDTPKSTKPMSDDLVAPTVNVSSSSSSTESTTSSEVDVAEQQVKSMLKNRVDAWNTRNLDRYMADYRRFDTLRVTHDGKTEKGWEAVYDFFAPKFGPRMGTLRINNMKIHMVGDFASIVSAEWNLQQENKITNGRMNLVVKNIDADWKITTENLTEK